MHRFGFTLVELIVVITILAILGTIAFTSFNGYTSSARDSARTSDLANITTGLELYQIKSGSYPVPSGTILTYTGGNNGATSVIQWTLNGWLVGFSASTPSDPNTKTPYVYSTLAGGSYYQIGAELESPLSGRMIPWVDPAYADGPKTALVKGNYISDPSLPSLIVVPGSVPVTAGSGGIFSPDVCFVTNGSSSNLLSAGSSGCSAKKGMTLKNLDSSLVGYWDMETTTTGGLLKDLSGNGNDGVFSGTSSVPYLTWWYLWQGLKFSTSSWWNAILVKSNVLNQDQKELSIGVIAKALGRYKYMNFLSKSFASYTWTMLVNETPFKLDFWPTYNPRFYFTWFSWSTYKDDSTYESKNPVDTNQFQMYSITFNNWKMRFFINWQYVWEWSISSDHVKWVDSYLEFGRWYWIWSYAYNNCPAPIDLTSNNCFQWIIDDVKIYNRALSDSEIKQQSKAAGF